MNTLLNHTIKKGIILVLIISIITIPPFAYAQNNGLDNPPIASPEPSISNQPKSPSTLEQEEIARRIAEAGAAAAAQAIKAAALAHFKRTIISILGNENASSTNSGEITPEPSDTETDPNISPEISVPPDNGGSTGNIISQAERIIPRLRPGLE